MLQKLKNFHNFSLKTQGYLHLTLAYVISDLIYLFYKDLVSISMITLSLIILKEIKDIKSTYFSIPDIIYGLVGLSLFLTKITI